MAEASKGSMLKDLVVTAAVASVVSALVSPWIRQWLDSRGLAMGQPPAMPPEVPPGGGARDEFAAQLERLLAVPDPFSPAAMAASETRRGRGSNTNMRSEVDDDEEDLEP